MSKSVYVYSVIRNYKAISDKSLYNTVYKDYNMCYYDFAGQVKLSRDDDRLVNIGGGSFEDGKKRFYWEEFALKSDENKIIRYEMMRNTIIE